MFTSWLSNKCPKEVGLTNNTPVVWCLFIIIATDISCFGFTFVSLPATVGWAYSISPTDQFSSPTAIEEGAVPRVSKPLVYPKWVTNPFTPMPISSVAKPKKFISLTLPSEVKGEASILPLPTVTPEA